MGERARAGFRRDYGGVRVAGPRNGRAGRARDAQAALCGALVLVALVQPSDRPRAGEEPTEATTHARERKGAKKTGCGKSERRTSGVRATEEHAPRVDGAKRGAPLD